MESSKRYDSIPGVVGGPRGGKFKVKGSLGKFFLGREGAVGKFSSSLCEFEWKRGT